MEAIRLYDLNVRIKSILSSSLPVSTWITCEISELNVNRASGHCYLELIEKSGLSDTIVAKARATIWRSNFEIIAFKFKEATGETLRAGLKVMVAVSVDYQEVYGLSLNIRDINPIFTLGDLAQQRLKIIERLKKEGIMEMNKELDFPTVPQRIAIISSNQAAGYEDFINQLHNNSFGINFYTKLFQASMQGVDTESSIVLALQKIFDYEELFDVVVIIRGGGSKSDLAWFDSYQIAANVAQFPLPVLSGIGHDRDQSVLDIVSYEALKTPTAVAEYLIECAGEFYNQVIGNQERLLEMSREILRDKNQKLISSAQRFQPLVLNAISRERSLNALYQERLINRANNLIVKQRTKLGVASQQFRQTVNQEIMQKQRENILISSRLKNSVNQLINNNNNKLLLLEKTNQLLDPSNLLKKGYSITYFNGKAVKDPSEVPVNSVIETRVEGGIIESLTLKAGQVTHIKQTDI